MADFKHALILINPRAGRGDAELVLQTLHQALHQHGWEVDTRNIEQHATPDQLAPSLKQAFEHRCSIVIAAGGDGTVSLVANALILSGLGHQLRLGVFPSGTANSFSKDLGVPQNWHAAAQMLASHPEDLLLDAMNMNNRCYFLRIGIGIDAEVIRDTSRKAKRWFGRFAYLNTFLSRFFRSHRHRFHCVLDGKHRKFKATQLFVANGGQIALVPFRIGPGIAFNDGLVNICAYDVRYWWHYFVVAWKLLWQRYEKQPLMKFWTITNTIKIHSRPPLPIQGDGEPCGSTPVVITVVPQALRVIANESFTRQSETREGEAPAELKPSPAPPPHA